MLQQHVTRAKQRLRRLQLELSSLVLSSPRTRQQVSLECSAAESALQAAQVALDAAVGAEVDHTISVEPQYVAQFFLDQLAGTESREAELKQDELKRLWKQSEFLGISSALKITEMAARVVNELRKPPVIQQCMQGAQYFLEQHK